MEIRRLRRQRVTGLLASLLLAGTAGLASTAAAPATPVEAAEAPTMQDVVPTPAEVQPEPGSSYTITQDTKIYIQPGSAGAAHVGERLAGVLRPSTGYELPVVDAPAGDPTGGISLLLSGAPEKVGSQGYLLDVTGEAVVIRANEPVGLFAGVQTLRQMLPATVESDTEQDGPWTVPGGRILDYPRFGYRGAMLDVARHFFSVTDVKRYIDLISMYKVNYLHLHLTDDQGWRIMIDGWERLATYGGSTEVGGGPGGYYTKAEYAEIIDYAQAHYITVIPEIDMPGHTNAALASYDKLNCDGTAPPLRTDIEVGYSSLCIGKEITYTFVEDVIRQVAEMTPGPYLHIGGDEAHQTSQQDYNTFMERVLPMVEKYGKRPLGWQGNGGAGVLSADPPSSVIAQYWGTDASAPTLASATQQGTKVVMSPAHKAYVDQKYNPSTEIGLDWAGPTSVKESYSWDLPYVNGVSESAVAGIEAPLWSETTLHIDHLEFLGFPRLPGLAELGWSPAAKTNWADYKQRLAAQGPRWEVMGVDFYRSPQVPWPGGDGDDDDDGGDRGSWAAGTSYQPGDQVTYNGQTYQCRQTHTALRGWEPPNVPALWQPV